MKHVSVREIQHKFRHYVEGLRNDDEIIVMNRKVPIAKITAIHNPFEDKIDWSPIVDRVSKLPKAKGKTMGEILDEDRGKY